jgi:hypothetical protein
MTWTVRSLASISSTTNNEVNILSVLKNALYAAGWTHKYSGNGVSNYSASSDVSSTMSTASSWAVLKHPTVFTLNSVSTQREILLRNVQSTSPSQFSISYSFSGGYYQGPYGNGSVGTATTAPTVVASDPYGSKTIGSSSFFTDGYTGYYNIVTADANEGYGFYLEMHQTLTGKPISIGMFGLDFLTNTSVGEIEPYVWLVFPAMHLTYDNTISREPYAWSGINTGTVSWGNPGNIKILRLTSDTYTSTGSVATLGISSYGTSDFYPIFYGSIGAGGTFKGVKGKSTILKWSGAQSSYNGSYIAITSSRDHVIIGDFALPWNSVNNISGF